MNKFLVENICLGTKDLSSHFGESILRLGNISYVETSLEYNNDYIIGKYLKKDHKIITSISSLEEYDIYLDYHLNFLKREKIDILLLNPLGNWEENLKSLISDEYADKIGISDGTIKDIERFKRITGEFPDYCSMRLSLLWFNKNLIDYCRENKIKIISYGILGGKYKEESMIETFTLQYLCAFASVYSDIICISSNTPERVIKTIRAIKEYIGKSLSEDDEKLYLLSKSVLNAEMISDKKIRKINSFIKLSNGEVISINDPEEIVSKKDLIVSFKNNLENIDNTKTTKIEEDIYRGLSDLAIPSDMNNIGEIKSIYRYYTISLLMNIFQTKYWRYIYTPIGDDIEITVVNKFPYNLFGKRRYTFFLSVSQDRSEKFYFRKIN